MTGGKQPATLYDSYGMAGQSWAAYDMQCSDMTSLIGNSVAGMVFDASKALDRVTITVYQSAAGEGILSWLTNSVDRLITSLGNAIYFPFLAPVIIIGAIWLAWQGLIRKRATRTIEGTIWMVIACAAAIWLIGRPADFTGLGKTVSNGITQTLNVAFSGLPAPAASNCVPVAGHDPQVNTASYNFTGGSGIVDQNANELWTVLVCKPWLDGEFGTHRYTTGKGAKPTVVNQYGRQLLWAQAIASNEKPTASLIQAKQDAYAGIAQSIKQNDPDVYSLFQGNQYSTRLEIAFASLFAALVAGRPGAADRDHADHPETRVPAAARGRAVLPHRRDASRVRPGGRAALGGDARRGAAQAGGRGPGAEHPAVRLLPDHGHQ